MINVNFTDEARNHILKKNSDSVTVDLVSLGACAGKYCEPAVWVGKSSYSIENYDLTNSNGIKVYIYKSAESEPDGLKISLNVEQGYHGPIESLNVSGLVYEKTNLG